MTLGWCLWYSAAPLRQWQPGYQHSRLCMCMCAQYVGYMFAIVGMEMFAYFDKPTEVKEVGALYTVLGLDS